MKNRYHLFSCPAEKFARFSIRRISVFCFILSLWFPAITRAQNVIETPVQAQFKKEAAGYFEQDDLVAAYPFYSQLLSNYPHDPTYNYRFGACMLYANGDKRRAERYILYGMKQGAVENLAYYYLGRAQHLNYEFDKAIRTYEKFEQIASPGELKKYPVTHLIEMCQNGKQLLVNSDELDV